jgi:NAD-binding of NADP-dependent 3-hydroxyisobutyrate dehydrogenase
MASSCCSAILSTSTSKRPLRVFLTIQMVRSYRSRRKMKAFQNCPYFGEAFVLATRAGLDPNVVLNAIKRGLAGSTVLNAKAPMVLSRNFKPGFRIRLHRKDLRNALQAAESMNVSLPPTSAIQQILIALMNQGKGDLDHSALVTFVEEMASLQITQAAVRQLDDAPKKTPNIHSIS